jgi:serine phosphatase RsbU (regulator of sigma subunit)
MRTLPAARVLAAALLGLLCTLPVAAEFWELPQSLGEGRFPIFFAAANGPVAIWQESRISGDTGSAQIRCARFEGDEWKTGSVTSSSYTFSMTGSTPPMIFSAAMAQDGRIAVAVSASGTRIDVFLSRDGGASFSSAGAIESRVTSVAPRIYPSAKGGWIVFATQGKSNTSEDSSSLLGEALSSVSIYSSTSRDGTSWTDFEPIVGPDEGLVMNFAPFSIPRAGRDIVVFQSFILGDEKLSSRYALMTKTSGDGGVSWSPARTITDFSDPSGGAESGPEYYDNQRPQLFVSGSNLYLAWERRKTKATQTRVWVATMDSTGQLNPKSASAVDTGTGSYLLSQCGDLGGVPAVVALEDRLKSNRTVLATLRDGVWRAEDLGLSLRSGTDSAGLVNFARALIFKSRVYALWQYETAGKSTVVAMIPVLKVGKPGLTPLNFTVGKRSRDEFAQARVELPRSAAGINNYSFIWKKTSDTAGTQPPSIADLWRTGTQRSPDETTLRLPATEDGAWTLWVSVEDRAGNRSPVAELTYLRKRNPPPPPVLIEPAKDDRGFLSSNTFDIEWRPPEGEDIAGYTWDFVFAGRLERDETVVPPAQQRGLDAKSLVSALSSYEEELVKKLGRPSPPGMLLGTTTRYSAKNIDNGYYLFSVAAIDTTGNISSPAYLFLRADKFIPYTTVTLWNAARDDFGRTTLKITGRGFTAEGLIQRVVLDRDGKAPYDIERELSRSDYSIPSDRMIEGFSFEDAEAGNYRIGLFHAKRGWYWTSPNVSIDPTGTIKYGLTVTYEGPSTFAVLKTYKFSIYDLFVFIVVLLASLGILLAARQIAVVAREGETIRKEALALITGGPMPIEDRSRAARGLRRRGLGLRMKFTLTITFLVVSVVALLSTTLGIYMVDRTTRDLGSGLEQRARVLLESAAQGGRFFLDTEEAVTQLSFLPDQSAAMEGAVSITITGNGQASRDVVFATNDANINAKLESSTLSQGSYVLGRSFFKKKGEGADPLAPLVDSIAEELEREGRAAIADELELRTRLAEERASLKPGKAGEERRAEINRESDQIEVRIREALLKLSNTKVGSIPAFDPRYITTSSTGYLFYKPVLDWRPSDRILYRGMVRLEVSTDKIISEVRDSTVNIILRALIIAAIALAAGVIGAFILSTIIVTPIRKLVAQIEKIRDTEDKEDLEGSTIEVASHDELYTLADTVNQMTEGLVKAAKDSKELIVGKGIQKMFIPLDPAPGSKVKLSTGRRDEKTFEVYGYYEGAKGVSGDYWDFKSINERYHYFIKCDISGKGVSAALIMVQVATMVINYFNEWKKAMPKTIDLTDLAYKINDFIEERQFVGRFAAFTLGLWDSQEGLAYLCEAGDRKLHVWDEDQGRLLEELLPDSPAAGPLASFMVQMKKPFVQVIRKLDHGDALILYTDGIDEAKRFFRDSSYKIVPCREVPDGENHENHSGGQDNEEFGYDRITSILEAVASRGSYTLVKQHNPVPGEVLSFDFSSCRGSLEEKVLALVSVEKVFRMYRDPAAAGKGTVLVDQKIDAFLERHFDQYRLYCSDKRPNPDPQNENPGYLMYHGVQEDPQYDDLTILAIRRK